MSKQKYYSRWQKNNVKQRLKTRRIVVIAGSRQCGKTTLAKQVVTKKDDFRTFCQYPETNINGRAFEYPLGMVEQINGY